MSLIIITPSMCSLKIDRGLGLGCALAETSDESTQSYTQRLRQVELYMDRALFVQARRELLKLIQTQQGERDYRVAKYLATCAHRLHDITEALRYLRVARRLTSDPQERAWIGDRYQLWSKSYGLVRFSSDPEGQGVIDLTSARRILNPDRLSVFKVAQEQLLKGVQTPHTLYLPYGSYLANSVSFQLKRGAPSPNVQLTLKPIAHVEESTNTSKWVYISLGGVALVAAILGGYALFQAPDTKERTLTLSFQ
jgi:hypothetical protein